VGAASALLLVAQTVAGGDPRVASSVGEPRAARPTVTRNLLAPVRRQLSLAFHFAQENIQVHPGCSALFRRFGVDGLEVLARVRFDAATFEKNVSVCKHGVAAYTVVGTGQIRLCPGFGVLSVPGAALVIIHEALHSAGLTERPSDPGGLSTQEINRLVEASCTR
jgi:hypothetical protein